MKWMLGLCLLLAPMVPAHAQVTFDRAKAEADVMRVLDDFMAAFNRQDAAAEERTYQFPHYRLASGRMAVLNGPGAEAQAGMNAAYRSLRESGWDHSAWGHRTIVHISDLKAHVDTEFVRYRKDNSVIGSFDSLYVVTRENGRWGIKLRSSFAP
ncbi:MAG TPA: hypothetical protein VH583_25760 [Vicinamibacterales bacterium]|jgi:hypothetical protein